MPHGALAPTRLTKLLPRSISGASFTQDLSARKNQPAHRRRIDSTMRPRKKRIYYCASKTMNKFSPSAKFLLETRGYRVLAASCAASRRWSISRAALPGSIDLLLSDLILPQICTDGNGTRPPRASRCTRACPC